MPVVNSLVGARKPECRVDPVRPSYAQRSPGHADPSPEARFAWHIPRPAPGASRPGVAWAGPAADRDPAARRAALAASWGGLRRGPGGPVAVAAVASLAASP